MDSSDTINRFVDIHNEDINIILETEENENTKKKNKQDMALFSSFLQNSQNETRDIHEIPPYQLDSYISKFLLSVRKRNGDNYEPTSLRGMVSSFERYFNNDTTTLSLSSMDDLLNRPVKS